MQLSNPFFQNRNFSIRPYLIKAVAGHKEHLRLALLMLVYIFPKNELNVTLQNTSYNEL